ncbi:hypothetical protein BC628DRAFT_1410623 [Trametes gibbosa]|uniref:RING-type domain-containing protein n=1 Tax=Trametes gibbosa TaxID=160864 RepID=A0A6G6FQJ4_9APHY|nr:hypothetical protein BC628DRAFT_1410623 [Trametes gibbosa]QIE48548.1 hypothetical protein [Trametes gibbosa]
MPEFVVDNDTRYCSLCDEYFITDEARTEHIQHSDNHPRCDSCNIRFANGNSLRVHYTISRKHNYCSSCHRHFNTAAGIRVHIELVHGGDDSDSDNDDPARNYDGWEDDVGREMFPDEDDFDTLPVSLDEAIDPEQVYWPEDSEPLPDELRELEEEEERAYSGWAPVPSPDDLGNESDDESDDTAGEEEVHSHTCTDSCNDAPGEKSSKLKAKVTATGTLSMDCPICLCPTRSPTATACGHVFCSSCIYTSVFIGKNCPVCRTKTVVRDLRKLFLEVAV